MSDITLEGILLDVTLVKKLNCPGAIDKPLAVILPNNVKTVETGIFNPPIAYVTSVLRPKIILFEPLIELPLPTQVELL